MATVTVYGASDDLIEVEGDLKEEFSGYEGTHYLAFSDGTLLSVKYDDGGLWRINRLVQGSAACVKVEATDPEDDYSDKVTLTGALAWVVCGKEHARARAK